LEDPIEQSATKVITAHIPVDLAQKVDLWSQKLDRPRGWIMKQALGAWIDGEEEKARLTREALQDIDSGKTVEHADVVAWAESLATGEPRPVPGSRL
jgi:predicted transcriptional regulator